MPETDPHQALVDVPHGGLADLLDWASRRLEERRRAGRPEASGDRSAAVGGGGRVAASPSGEPRQAPPLSAEALRARAAANCGVPRVQLPMSEVRANFSEYLLRVGYGKEVVVMTRNEKPLVAMIPIEWLAYWPD